jgi:phage terminase large subunit-like protein
MTKHNLDYPTTKYCLDVLMGEIISCDEVKLACQRHINDLEREDIWFDYEAADKFFRYCARFKHYKGPMKGQPLELDDWQKFIFGSLYGWKKCVKMDVFTHDEPGKIVWMQRDIWKYKSAYIEVAKKNGKSTLCGAVASYDAFVMEDTGAEVYCLATKEDQAKIVWNDCNVFVQNSDFNHMFRTIGKTIFVEDTSKSSFIKPLGRDSKSNDGLNPFSAIVDELHAHPTREILDIIEDGFVGRDNYHLIIITTAGHNQHGVCYQERNHSKRVLRGDVEGDSKFCIIYTVDEEDKENWDQEHVWYKSNPGLGKGKSLDAMRDAIQKATDLPSKRNTVLTKQLNIWTSVAEVWVQAKHWKRCQGPLTLEDVRGKRCWGGMDLARVNDMSAVPYFFPPQAGLEKWTVFIDYFVPDSNVADRVKLDKVPYDIWIEEGYLTTTVGNTTDFMEVKKRILQRAKIFNILGIGFDKYFGGEIIAGLEAEGIEMIPVGSNHGSMNIPCCEFERMVMGDEIEVIHNPILDWNVENTVITKDADGKIKPDKSKSQERIDGLVALVIALGAKMFEKAHKKRSPYNERGLRTT